MGWRNWSRQTKIHSQLNNPTLLMPNTIRGGANPRMKKGRRRASAFLASNTHVNITRNKGRLSSSTQRLDPSLHSAQNGGSVAPQRFCDA
ncbi:hypothetical protein LIER_14788 [Lithospermum erythrorhizon]|uniref:Uncharacterized protein n=1 Tax=Lithospermum erythrorhizon TaxID=34254 RepID=A0AAV3Q1Y0_LITER